MRAFDSVQVFDLMTGTSEERYVNLPCHPEAHLKFHPRAIGLSNAHVSSAMMGRGDSRMHLFIQEEDGVYVMLLIIVGVILMIKLVQ